jgi:hypothetical protein
MIVVRRPPLNILVEDFFVDVSKRSNLKVGDRIATAENLTLKEPYYLVRGFVREIDKSLDDGYVRLTGLETDTSLIVAENLLFRY